MASLEGSFTNKSPLFTGTNYAFQKVRMRTYLMSLGIEVWVALEENYAPKETNTEKEAKQNFIANAK